MRKSGQSQKAIADDLYAKSYEVTRGIFRNGQEVKGLLILKWLAAYTTLFENGVVITISRVCHHWIDILNIERFLEKVRIRP